MRPVLLLATSNPAKLDRLRWIVEGLPVRTETPAHVEQRPPSEEMGESHGEIAEAKAIAWSRAMGGLALASDGGVDIPALGAHWEALLTRRAAGPGAADAQRAEHLLELMGDLAGEQRRACWREAAALADSGRLIGSWEVQSDESMLIAHRYDPLGVPEGFYVPGLLEFPRFGRRFGLLGAEDRERALNHWAKLRPMVRNALRRHLAQD